MTDAAWTNADVEAIARSQNFRCAICGNPGKLFIDHDHVTGKVRGMLCRKCNIGLGHFGDSASFLASASTYLRRHSPTVETWYCSGPMTGYPGYNHVAFAVATEMLRAQGKAVISPAEHDQELDIPLTGSRTLTAEQYRQLLEWDLDTLRGCTHIYMMAGWESSRGATLERLLAKTLGLQVVYECPPSPQFVYSRSGATPRLRVVSDEVRITDPVTGGQKGQKLAQLGAIDPLALQRLAEVAGYGGIKYDRMNYMKGYRWSLSMDALMRHALALWNGEDIDPESGLPHGAHLAWHGLALVSFMERGLGTDDRYKG